MKKTLLSALKHGSGILLTLFSLLLSCQVWAWTGTLYFDNSATQWANVSIMMGHDTYYRVYPCTQVANTDVWYFTNTNEWGTETSLFWVNSQSATSNESSVTTFANGFQDRNITVDQISTTGGGADLAGYIMKPTSSIGRSAGTTWVSYNASDYTSISGNGRLVSTDGYSEDTYSYAYIKVLGYTQSNDCGGWYLCNSNYGENSGTLKGWYRNTSSTPESSIVKASTYIGYNSSDQRFLYRFNIEEYFTGLIPLTTDAETGSTTWSGSRYYFNNNIYLSPYSGNTTCYFDLTGTVSSNQQMSQFTSLSAPTVTSSANSGLIGSTFTISLASGSSSTFSGGDRYHVYASDGSNLYEICQPKTADADISWTPTTPGEWTLYAITTDKYGAERKKSSEITVNVTCYTPAEKSVSISASEVCAGSDVTVTVAGSQDGYVYKVYDSSSFLMAKATGTGSNLPITFTPGASTTYTVKAAQSERCSGETNMSNTVSITVNDSPVITASATSVTNYTPVTLTNTGADVTTWSVSGGVAANRYLYKESVKGAMFKGTVGGSDTPVTYTITGAASNSCSSAVNVTVNSNSDNCQ